MLLLPKLNLTTDSGHKLWSAVSQSCILYTLHLPQPCPATHFLLITAVLCFSPISQREQCWVLSILKNMGKIYTVSVTSAVCSMCRNSMFWFYYRKDSKMKTNSVVFPLVESSTSWSQWMGRINYSWTLREGLKTYFLFALEMWWHICSGQFHWLLWRITSTLWLYPKYQHWVSEGDSHRI